MKKIFFLLASVLISLAVASAQDIVVKSFDLLPGDLSAKVNPQYDANGVAGALINVTVASEDVGFEGNIIAKGEYNAGIWPIYVPSGTKFLRVAVKGYISTTVDFPVSIESFRAYELKIELPSKERTRVLVMGNAGIGATDPVHLSYGIMVGVVKKFGGYLKAKSDFVFNIPTVGECNESGFSGDTWIFFSDGNKKSRWSVTGGGMARIAKPLYVYLGAGYGERVLAWQDQSGDYYRITGNDGPSFIGVEAETGLILRLGPVAISAGVQTNSFHYWEANIGIGILL